MANIFEFELCYFFPYLNIY